MKTFRQINKEYINKGFLAKRKAKDIIGADSYMIIAPKFKRVNPFNPTKEYGMGYKDDLEAFAKKELKGAPYEIRKTNL